MWSVDDDQRCGLLHVSYKRILYSIRNHENYIYIYILKNATCHIFSKCFHRAFEDEPEKHGLGTRQTNFKAVLC